MPDISRALCLKMVMFPMIGWITFSHSDLHDMTNTFAETYEVRGSSKNVG